MVNGRLKSPERHLQIQGVNMQYKIKDTERGLNAMIDKDTFNRLEKLAEFNNMTSKEFIEKLINKQFFDLCMQDEQFRKMIAKEDLGLFLNNPEVKKETL